MKKYAIVTLLTDDAADGYEGCTVSCYDTLEAATEAADKEWNSLPDTEKERYDFYDIWHSDCTDEGFDLVFATIIKAYKGEFLCQHPKQ